MKKYRFKALLVAAAFVCSGNALAHHSFVQFDSSKTILLDGTVTKFEWTNPHGWLWVTVTDRKGNAEIWGAETKAISGLVRDGWTKRSFRPGDKLKLYIHPMYNSTRAGEFIKAILPNGSTLQPAGGSPGGGVGANIIVP